MTLPARARRRGATIYDVAARAGVSHQTVTRVLKDFEGIRPETRKRVQEALVELDYRPNLTARSLATNSSHRVGALVYELLQVGPSKTIQGASDAARRAGYVLDIVTVDPEDSEAVDRAFAVMMQQDLAGILAFAPMDLLGERIRASDFAVPVLMENARDEAAAAGHASVSDQGMDQLIDHLVGLGHRSIAHVSGPLTWWASRNRVAAFERALERHGVSPAGVIEGAWSAESGHRAASRIDPDAVSAVVAANDQMALGVLRAFAERGIPVPERVSVTGFDDMPESAYFQPPLTTIRLDYEGQGRAFMNRMLVALGAQPADGDPPHPAELIERASTAPPA